MYCQKLLTYIYTYSIRMISGAVAATQYPEFVLALHSSKRLLVEQLNSSYHLLADAIINLTLAKGKIIFV